MLPPSSTASLSPAVLLRHVKPGPRYTSYPSAAEFHAGFTAREAREELARVGPSPSDPVSLYLHIPFCRSLCWYCGCNVVISRNAQVGSSYVDTLCKEIELLAQQVGPNRPLSELSVGGGSPNFLDPADLARLSDTVRSSFDLTPDAELGIELDPRETTAAQVVMLSEFGFNRVSIGVQDFAPQVQKLINRKQSIEQTTDLIDCARASGYNVINMDLIYGLPGQTVESFGQTMDIICDLGANRIALFGYAHLPHLRPHQKLVERDGPIPDTTLRAELLAVALERFAAAGYLRVGMDHFALPDDELVKAAMDGRLHRNFQGYVVRRATDLLACGTTGISSTGSAHWQNLSEVDEWRAQVEAGKLPVRRGIQMNEDDRIRGHVISRLMCDAELSWAEVDGLFDIDFAEYFAAEIAALSTGEYTDLIAVDEDAKRFTATPLGCNLIRNVCMVFDRYGKAPVPGKPRFSSTL